MREAHKGITLDVDLRRCRKNALAFPGAGWSVFPQKDMPWHCITHSFQPTCLLPANTFEKHVSAMLRAWEGIELVGEEEGLSKP